MPYGVLALTSIVLLVYSLLDVATTPASAMRTLPKPLWLVVVLAPLFGPAAWFLAGRPPRGTARSALRRPQTTRSAPDDDEEFLRALRRRAEEQRRRARDPRDDPPPGSPA